MLGRNFSALTIVLFSLIFGWGSPVTALQILIIKVACDGIPGFSLCVEKADPDIMKQTMTFLVMGLTTVVHVYNCRTHLSIFQKGRGVNKLVIGTTLLGTVIMILIVAIPPVAQLFGLVPLGIWHWVIVFALSLMPLIYVEILKLTNQYAP